MAKARIDSEFKLPERAESLLRTLVESYIGDGMPVGSRTLAKASALDLSAATIRNVMADLEELGLIESPHTSAGRIPTAAGFRFFVDSLLEVRPLKGGQLDSIRNRLNPDIGEQQLLASASDMLSGITRMAGVVSLPRKDNVSFRHIEFLSLSGNRVLAILVLNQQEVQNRVLQLDREYSASELEQAANYLNSTFFGNDLRTMRQRLLTEMDDVRRDMNNAMLDAIALGEKALNASEDGEDDFVLAGQSNLFDYDELSDVAKLQQLFKAFNEKRGMLHLLDRCLYAEGVCIFIGQESENENLQNCSVVSAPYTVDGEIVGVLGVIGPTRMQYERVIPVVDVTAQLLGSALRMQRG